MSCLEMHKSINGDARISFSNEFVEIIGSEKSNNAKSNNINTRSSLSKPSSDFEFSVSDYTMIPADEIILKGKILPYKETRTLREELLVEEEDHVVDGNIFSLRPQLLPSSSFSTKGTWKELLGLKKAHVRSKKTDRINEEENCSPGQDHKTISV
ncbi:hypothetical protein EUTSA_v10010961mg [Eutrema salsugineum]|uniref:Uncharacterized protein n=1 Tax=Eutrema salsugineum TaxID=72664 RepID=V4LNW8_EUTSA|nr:uncharacterized protein LOC18021160 [Eutrema salsugineum]ESQ45469.1 hypothetical protein EUTSA_v10010961mg [Eutrema salsugineum]